MDGIGRQKRNHFIFLAGLEILQEIIAPSKVAIVPNIISNIAAPESKLNNRQPIVNPEMAAGVKNGRIVRASEIRIWIAPEASPKALLKNVLYI